MRPRFLPISMAFVLGLAGQAAAASWSPFQDPSGRYSIDLPASDFQQGLEPSQPGHLTFTELDGEAIIDVYSGRNLKRLRPAEFIRQLSRAPRIADISYSALGRTWFAISGHYVRDGSAPAGLIYYAKFVFSADLTQFAAFEISYPVAEKRRMDAIVTHLEKSLRLSR